MECSTSNCTYFFCCIVYIFIVIKVNYDKLGYKILLDYITTLQHTEYKNHVISLFLWQVKIMVNLAKLWISGGSELLVMVKNKKNNWGKIQLFLEVFWLNIFFCLFKGKTEQVKNRQTSKINWHLSILFLIFHQPN